MNVQTYAVALTNSEAVALARLLKALLPFDFYSKSVNLTEAEAAQRAVNALTAALPQPPRSPR